MRITLIAATLALGSIAGCSTAPPKPPASAPAASAASAPRTSTGALDSSTTRSRLVIEKLRLAELFRGTPVVFVLQADGSMRVEVPLQFSFDAGKSIVKPPLAAVLDRIATGQRNEATRIAVSAPGDAGAKAAVSLVTERAASVHDYLVAHGLADARVSIAPGAAPGSVRIVVADAALP